MRITQGHMGTQDIWMKSRTQRMGYKEAAVTPQLREGLGSYRLTWLVQLFPFGHPSSLPSNFSHAAHLSASLLSLLIPC